MRLYRLDFINANQYLLPKKLISLLLCLFSYSSPCLTQTPEVGEFITTQDGHSQGYIYDIIQDKDGFMWFATKDGLNRYDGYNFKIFTNNPVDPNSISANKITELFIDSSERLWAMTSNAGINIYDKENGIFRHIYHDPKDRSSLSGDNVRHVIELEKNEFLVTVDNNIINRIRLVDSFFYRRKIQECRY